MVRLFNFEMNKKRVADILVDLAKIIFAIGFYGIVAKEIQHKISFAVVSMILCLSLFIFSLVIDTKKK